MGISDIAKKLIGDKRRWRAYRARIRALPETYRTAASGIERYVMYTGPGDGDALMAMLDDLADLFEEAVANGTPVRDVVGDDPADFADTFKRNYGQGTWIDREKQRLTDAIEQAERDEGAPS